MVQDFTVTKVRKKTSGNFYFPSANIKGYIVELEEYDVNDFEQGDLKEEISTQTGLQDFNDTIIQMSPNVSKDELNDQNNTPTTNTQQTTSGTNQTNNTSNNSSINNNTSSNNSSTVVVPNNNSSNNNSNNGKPTTNTTPHTGNSSGEITEETVIKPTGQTSSNGRTKRSALTDIIIAPGDPNDPNIDISKYKNNIEYGFEVTTGNLTYQLCEEDIELLCAIVSAESDKSYDDALAVITTILNRCETSNWINSHGRDPIAQATAPNQFVVYQHGSYESYMNGKAPNTVKQAVMDALAGVRNHDYCSFRSNGSTSYSNNMISSTGNRYK